VKRIVSRLGRIAVIASMCIGAGAARLHAAPGADAIVASGTLDGRFLAGSLFHIAEFWMRVAKGTEFHRWLSQGLDHHVVIRLAPDTARSGDEKNVRVLSGTAGGRLRFCSRVFCERRHRRERHSRRGHV